MSNARRLLRDLIHIPESVHKGDLVFKLADATVDARPIIDGQPVPVLGASEWLDVTDMWLSNRHRHHAPTGTDTVASQGPVT